MEIIAEQIANFEDNVTGALHVFERRIEDRESTNAEIEKQKKRVVELEAYVVELEARVVNLKRQSLEPCKKCENNKVLELERQLKNTKDDLEASRQTGGSLVCIMITGAFVWWAMSLM